MEKPALPKGTRDFGPSVMAKRQFILTTIRTIFETYGFQPLETPAMENLSTLTGKYGDEGDQLLFRVLDSGEFFSDSSVVVAKASHYLIQSMKHLVYEFFAIPNEERYKFVEYLQKEELTKPEILHKWLQKYYHTNILKGRMVESLYYNIDFLVNSHLANENFLRQIAGFISKFIKDHSSNLENRSKEEIDHILNYYLIENYNLLYSIIGAIVNPKLIRNQVSEKGLRYDLTVPFARYVVMNRHEITLPFKRYQIQPVWRADRPQKGRYREFYQCDADVVGTDSLICEAEIVLMIKEVMHKLNINNYSIKINHRGVLNGIAETLDAVGKENDLFVAIDKLDKIGEAGVHTELTEKGFASNQIDGLFKLLGTKGSNREKLTSLKTTLAKSTAGLKGTGDLTEVFDLLNQYQADDNHVEFDIALARGLSYYTGCIFEVKINDVVIGSVSGGGRYDNLTQAFGSKEQLSGVGISFGIDRLYDAMEELKLFPKETLSSSKVLVCHFDETTRSYGLALLTQLRAAGINSEIYPDVTKLKKQLDYANKKMIAFCLVVGEEEMKSGDLTIKNMESGEQEKLTINTIIHKLVH
mgnify:CR=1 FL=1